MVKSWIHTCLFCTNIHNALKLNGAFVLYKLISQIKREPLSLIMANTKLKNKLHEIIFEADTRAGKAFDVWLLIFIILSITLVMLDSIEPLHKKYLAVFYWTEWVFTGLFTIEYVLRIYSVKKPIRYILSFYGIVDLISILPSYIGIFYNGVQFLRVFRTVRVLRLFKVFKLNSFTRESKNLIKAIQGSGAKIIVFITAVLCVAVIMGAIMYIVEGKSNGFTSIPRSVYWAIVTLTTVGFGDISPVTPLGQLIASVLMILGYGIIAVPTGLVSAEFARDKTTSTSSNTQVCRSCAREGHADDAIYCKYCGDKLND